MFVWCTNSFFWVGAIAPTQFFWVGALLCVFQSSSQPPISDVCIVQFDLTARAMAAVCELVTERYFS